MPRHLPVIQPTSEPRFASLRERENELLVDIDRLSLDELCRFPLLSGNAKTSLSLDFPIGHTCSPTALCASVCYASRPGTPARWDKSVAMRLRTLRYFQMATAGEAADRLWHEFDRLRRLKKYRGTRIDFLRVNGTGDLTHQVVAALNLFSAAHPDVTLWVVSRLPTIAAWLVPRPNVYLQLSTDATTTRGDRTAMQTVVNSNPRAYLSFLRTKPDDDPKGAAIIFHENRTAGLPGDGVAECPVDSGKLDLGNVRGVGGTACSRCRKCFSPKTLERQRAA